MSIDRITTRFIDSDGLDIGCHLVTKEYLMEVYPDIIREFKDSGFFTWGAGQNTAKASSAGWLGNNNGATTIINSPIQTVAGGLNWLDIVPGAAIKTDGSLWVWGGNVDGRVGDNSTTDRSSPVQTFAGGTNWKQVSGGYFATSSIKDDGTLWTWGYNFNGQLGNNSVGARSSPVQTISGGSNWKRVSMGDAFAAATKTDGTLWLWGQNACGQLGDGTIVSKSSPVQTVSTGTNWKEASAGLRQTAAIKTDGTLWLWGRGPYGAVGDLTTTNRNSPVQTVAGGSNWRRVDTYATTAAIKTDGTLWVWGRGQYGEMGNNNTIHQSSPIQTISGGSNWVQISTGIRFVTAIKSDGTLWSWGNGNRGNHGDNTNLNRSSPIQTISGGTTWVCVVAGKNVVRTTAAIKELGSCY